MWNDVCEQAFVALKEKLTTPPVLHAPDFSHRFLLQTDASNLRLGAVLAQLDKDGTEHPIAYLSRKLLAHEQKYSVPEKECLAVVWAINKFKYYLYGREFTVLTDHRALQWLDKCKTSNSRLLRWAMLLQEYTFSVQYRKGSSNANADGLSRA